MNNIIQPGVYIQEIDYSYYYMKITDEEKYSEICYNLSIEEDKKYYIFVECIKNAYMRFTIFDQFNDNEEILAKYIQGGYLHNGNNIPYPEIFEEKRIFKYKDITFEVVASQMIEFAASLLSKYIGTMNDNITRKEIVDKLIEFDDSIAVICDETNNSPKVIDNGRIVVDIYKEDNVHLHYEI